MSQDNIILITKLGNKYYGYDVSATMLQEFGTIDTKNDLLKFLSHHRSNNLNKLMRISNEESEYGFLNLELVDEIPDKKIIISKKTKKKLEILKNNINKGLKSY